jgi:hypothetical protein
MKEPQVADGTRSALIEQWRKTVEAALAGVSEITNCRKWKERGCDCRVGGQTAALLLIKLKDELEAALGGVPQEPKEDVRSLLRKLFIATDAEAIEIHSGDREPGTYISREKLLAGDAADGPPR